MVRFVSRFRIVLLLLLAAPAPVFAQASISGVVKDASGGLARRDR